jgi:Holliday junction resolvase-like predicted endonuclease
MWWSYYSKELGKKAEQLVKMHYIKNWYIYIQENRTMRWWELDLIFKNKNETLVIVEVKCVDHTDDLIWYIGKKKLLTLKKSIETYCTYCWLSYNDIRLDCVFVKHDQIYEIFENIQF